MNNDMKQKTFSHHRAAASAVNASMAIAPMPRAWPWLIVLLVLVAAGLPRLSRAGETPTTSRFQVGTLHVTVHGDHGTPLILIPGLGSGAWVWQGTIDRFADTHVIYALTLAGFGGTPAPAKMDDLMGQAEDSLLRLIQERKIDHPVLIGHSLGGTLAIAFAEKHSNRLAGVVAVDGMPIFPGFERLTPEQRKAAAQRAGAALRDASAEQFRQQQIGYMRTMGVLDPAAAQKYGALQARSDPATVAGFMVEDLDTDLRAQLADITVPVLEISPYNEADFKAAAASGRMPMFSEAQKTAYYRGLLKGTPQLEVVSISPARHFVMLDQAQRFQQALARFLDALPAAP